MNVFNNAGNQIRNFFPETTKAFGHGSAFLSTNSLVSKVVFLLLVLILFIFLFRTASMILGMFFLPSQNPKLVKGMKDAKKIKVISQNPKVKGSIPKGWC